MSFGEDDGGSEVELETLHGRNWPTVTQFSIFLENRVGQLLEVVRQFHGSKVKIVGLTISDSADCSIIRLILSHPEQGREILALNKHTFAENELIAVELSTSPNALAELCQALLQAEINIHYAYPLIVHPHGRAAVAMHIDNNEQASRTLNEMGFDILCEADLAS
ncbi:MAG: acetolactate synthase [Isosphaeraceae bacterium]